MSKDGLIESRTGLWTSVLSLFASSSTLVCFCATVAVRRLHRGQLTLAAFTARAGHAVAATASADSAN
jgi:hypothetical protein